jgi:putative DNA primase/helicase
MTPPKEKRDPKEAARRASARAEAGKAKHAKPLAKPKDVVFPVEELWRAVSEEEEVGLANLGVKALKQHFAYDMQRGVFLELTPGGGYFAEDHSGQIKVELQKALRPQLEQQRDALTTEAYRQDTSKEDRGRAEAARKKYISALKRLSSKHSLDNLTDLMRTGRDSLARDNSDFDRDPWALHCLNCRVDLRTGQEREGRHEDMSTKYCQAMWRGLQYEHPAWNAYMESLLPADMAEYLQHFVGYAITGIQRKAFAIFFSKFSDSGKTLLLETFKSVFGNYAGMLPAALLMEDKKGKGLGPTPELAALQGLRLAFLSESGKSDHFEVARLKWLTGGDTLVARGLFAKPVSFEPTHTLFLASNHLARIGIDEDAMWGRIHVFKFPYAFKDNPAKPHERPIDPDLKDQLRQEEVKSAILAWAVRGCLAWQGNGQKFTPPLSSREALENYRLNEDYLESFVRACCFVGKDYREQAKPLHEAYSQWHVDEFGSNSKPLGRRKFCEAMAGKFEKDDDGRYHYYLGLQLKNSF